VERLLRRAGLRNQEATRYARLSAMVAALIVLGVAGVYFQRAFRGDRDRRAASPTVPSEVQQQSANFSYSDVEQGRTIFTLRASHATQFKEQNRALLENVWITIYGRDGNRNDNIHTRRCNYEPNSGGIRCEGEVELDIQDANAASGKSPASPLSQRLKVKTNDLIFNRQTGQASTSAPVEFSFAQGQGRGVGISYSTHDSIVHIDRNVQFDLKPSDSSAGLPVTATGSSLEIRRDDRLVVLAGPATVRQGDRDLSAGKISIILDKEYRAQEIVAEDHPSIQGHGGSSRSSVSAGKFEALLNPQGGVASLVADGNVAGMRHSAAGTDRFIADHVGFAMAPGQNLIGQMTAMGGVAAQSQQGGDSRMLKTEALKVNFSPSEHPQQRRSAAQRSHRSAEQQKIESAETLAPATIESTAGNETTHLSAKKFFAQFSANGRLDKLLGHEGVEVRRQVGHGIAQLSSSEELVATFSSNGEWDSIDESGRVHFVQADREGNAAKARMSRVTGLVTLEGAPVLSDSMSRTTAGSVTINQQSGNIHAAGGVVSTYIPPASGMSAPISLGAGAAHVAADSLEGSSSSGQVTYSGHARLWQGQSLLEAEQIQIWRDEKKMEAQGQVVAVFEQAPGAGPSFAMLASKTPVSTAKLTLWQVRAPSLTYWSDQGKAHLEGGVAASSSQGSLEARTLDVFLSAEPGAAAPAPASNTATPASAAIAKVASGNRAPGAFAAESRGLSRILAQGAVIVRQGDRRGAADQAEYTAADQKFVLSGGQPMITDASTDTTTVGRSLTFFVASDTILIDSQVGLRTLTKHRVEK
jgi:lipopolysaccharide export system protein LptA